MQQHFDNWAILRELGFLNEDNTQAIPHANSEFLAHALTELRRLGLLNEANRQAIIHHINPSSLAHALADLNRIDILIDIHRQALINHAQPYGLAMALGTLHTLGMLDNPSYFEAAINHPNPQELSMALSDLRFTWFLYENSLDNASNRKILMTHANPRGWVYALKCLHQANILNPDSRALIASDPHPLRLATSLVAIHERQAEFRFFRAFPPSIVIHTHDNATYLQLRSLLPDDMQAIAVPILCHYMREHALNLIIAKWLHLNHLCVPQVMQFLEQNILRVFALKYIEDIAFPPTLENSAEYQEALAIRLQPFLCRKPKTTDEPQLNLENTK